MVRKLDVQDQVSASLVSPEVSVLDLEREGCLLAVSSNGVFSVHRSLVPPLLNRTPVMLDEGCALGSHVTLPTSLKALSPEVVTVGAQASTQEL